MVHSLLQAKASWFDPLPLLRGRGLTVLDGVLESPGLLNELKSLLPVALPREDDVNSDSQGRGDNDDNDCKHDDCEHEETEDGEGTFIFAAVQWTRKGPSDQGHKECKKG